MTRHRSRFDQETNPPSNEVGRPPWSEAQLRLLPWNTLINLVTSIAADHPSTWPRIEAALALAQASERDEYFVGESPPMLRVFEEIRRFAPTEATVLITGESGTGKELVARALHERSPRRCSAPFVAINCASMTPTLIASELFGHEKGAFTGAVSRRIGLLEHANRGTVFLDEIGDLPLEQQGHLLRFFERKTIIRVGGNTEIPLDVRVVSATNVPLEERMRSGLFREDLYFRLATLSIRLPPLRERGDDVLLLARYFLQEICREFGKNFTSLSPEAMEALRGHAWPGNVRELLAVMRRAVVMGVEPTIEKADLGPLAANSERATGHTPPSAFVNGRYAEHPPNNTRVPERSSANKADFDQIVKALEAAGGRHSVAARLLGISRATLFRRLHDYKLMGLVVPQEQHPPHRR